MGDRLSELLLIETAPIFNLLSNEVFETYERFLGSFKVAAFDLLP